MSASDRPDPDDKGTAPIPLFTTGTSPSRRAPASDPTVRAVPKKRSAPPPPKHAPGSHIDRYIVEKLLGRGGMAEVYQAHDPKLRRKVALKILHGDQKHYGQKRLVFEAQAAANFHHPNSVIIYDVGEAGDDTFIAMELIRGRRLSECARDASVPLPRKIRWLVSIARALAAAHRRGLVHRDIKPANVMIREEDSVAKVLDFGIARQVFPEGELEGDITDDGQMVGTIRYAAPEQISGENVDGRADQFSWGITAYQLLAGRIPFIEQDTMAVASRVVYEEAPSLRTVAPDLPDEVIAVIDRAISRKPEDRFPSMDDAADALDAFAEGGPHHRVSTLPSIPELQPPPSTSSSATPGSQTPTLSSARTAGPGERTRVSATGLGSKRKWILAAGGAIGLATALGAFTLMKPQPTEKTASPSAPARVEIQGLRCAPAAVTGDTDAEVARALGIAACARLGIELGVPWSISNGNVSPVKTSVTFGPEAEASVEVSGQRATAKGSTPLHAVSQAVLSLTESLSAPALTERDLAAWGAKSEAGARRIERAWRKRLLWIGGDGSADARALVQSDPDSPIPHLLVLMSGAPAKGALNEASKKALALAGQLSPAREKMLRGLLYVLREETNEAEAAKLLRIAYAEAPEDADVAAMFAVFAVHWGLPEAYGALDRLTGTAPSRSLLALESALSRSPKRDLDRIDRYAAKIGEIFPEARATPPMIRALVTRRKLDEARAALALARKIGLNKPPAEPLVLTDGALEVELASGNAAEARKLALELLGDPGPLRQVIGGHGVASSHLLEGQAGRAEAVLWESAERHRGVGSEKAAVAFALRALAVRRLLKQVPVEQNRLNWLWKSVGEGSALPLAMRAEALVELALTQTGIDTFRVRTETLTQVEAMASALPENEKLLRSEVLVKTIPLVRALRGDRLAIERWKATEDAPFTARLRPAFDVALAMDATGDLKGARATYELAADAWNLREGMLERVLSIYKLSKLVPRMMEASDHKKQFDALWKDPEPAARAALELIR